MLTFFDVAKFDAVTLTGRQDLAIEVFLIFLYFRFASKNAPKNITVPTRIGLQGERRSKTSSLKENCFHIAVQKFVHYF